MPLWRKRHWLLKKRAPGRSRARNTTDRKKNTGESDLTGLLVSHC